MSKAKFLLGLVVIAFIFFACTVYKWFEQVDAKEIVVIQHISGDIEVHTSPGIVVQAWGKVTRYPVREDLVIAKRVRFNDGGHGTLQGSMQYEYPLDKAKIIEIHRKFSTPESVDTSLVRTTVEKSAFVTGPIMSSTESSSSRRAELLTLIEDQIVNGIYVTTQTTTRVKDEISGEMKEVKVGAIKYNPDGTAQRQGESAFTEFGIRPINFSITDIVYDDAVEAQIATQQALRMKIQTSMAEKATAEQEAQTAEANGARDAAKAKWAQETINAQVLAEAKQIKEKAELEAAQRLNVAKQNKLTAQEDKQSAILRGEGEAEAKRLAMEADGALQARLEAAKQINQFYASAIAQTKTPLVPSVVMGGGAEGGRSYGIDELIQILVASNAKQLGLENSIPAQ